MKTYAKFKIIYKNPDTTFTYVSTGKAKSKSVINKNLWEELETLSSV